MKKALYIFGIVSLICVWGICFRNQCEKKYTVRQYSLNSIFDLDFCQLTANNLCVMSKEEIINRFSICDDSVLQCENYAVAYFDISCDEEKWNDTSLEKLISGGFIRKSWFNGVNPTLFYVVNGEKIKDINNNLEGSFCAITEYNTQKNYSENDKLEYVLTTYPELVKIISN